MTKNYTYADFAKEILAVCADPDLLTDEMRSRMSAKAADLLAVQEKKASYNATHQSAKSPKGASQETMNKANAIRKVLSSTPKTGAEINAEMGTDYTALQIANAVKYIEGVKTCKVIRTTVNAKGLKSDKEYTAYTIG